MRFLNQHGLINNSQNFHLILGNILKPTLMKTQLKFTFFNAIIVALFVSTVFISCGDDDPITLGDSSATFTELNTCDIGSGSLATRFSFTIPYETSGDVTISKVLFDINWSSGDTDNSQTTNFNDTGSRIEYNWCYRYGSEDWVEITHRLELSDGTTSNSSTVTIDKPDGAN